MVWATDSVNAESGIRPEACSNFLVAPARIGRLHATTRPIGPHTLMVPKQLLARRTSTTSTLATSVCVASPMMRSFSLRGRSRSHAN